MDQERLTTHTQFFVFKLYDSFGRSKVKPMQQQIASLDAAAAVHTRFVSYYTLPLQNHYDSEYGLYSSRYTYRIRQNGRRISPF